MLSQYDHIVTNVLVIEDVVGPVRRVRVVRIIVFFPRSPCCLLTRELPT